MKPVLVVGATGQLGFAAVKELLAQGRRVRALIRDPLAQPRFSELGAETITGDLTQLATLTAACNGVAQVVATANAAVPSRAADTFEAVDLDGYRNLIQAAVDAKVERFIYTSVIPVPSEQKCVLFRLKRRTEERIKASGMDYVIFRAAPFMDVTFTMMGSDIPLRGTEAATLHRPFAFGKNHFERIKDSIEKKHIALIAGKGDVPQAFICVDDVARFLAAAVTGGPSGVHNLTGPEALTALDAVHLYEQVLGAKLKVKHTPAFVFRAMSRILAPFNPAAANLMRLTHIGATEKSTVDEDTPKAFQVSLTSAHSYLRQRVPANASHTPMLK